MSEKGTLRAWGENRYGELGDGTTTTREEPTEIGVRKWVRLAASYRAHSFGIDENRHLYGWGLGAYGRLGNGHTDDKHEPTQTGIGIAWLAVAAGDGHSVALTVDGKLYTTGSNRWGQVGVGESGRDENYLPIHKTSWTQVCSESTVEGVPDKWKAIAAGYNHTVGISADGELFTWGENRYGELGNGTSGWDTEVDTPSQIGTDTDWDTVVSCTHHNLALKENGELWAWGSNRFGQLGNGESGGTSPYYLVENSPIQIGEDTDWEMVAVGGGHSLALKGERKLYAWGANGIGQLGDGTTTSKSTPTAIGNDEWKTIDAGGWHSLGVKEDGDIYTWGRNGEYQLGDGTTNAKNEPDKIDGKDGVIVAGGGRYSLGVFDALPWTPPTDGLNIWAKIGPAWKKDDTWVKKGAGWKSVTGVWVKKGAEWKVN